MQDQGLIINGLWIQGKGEFRASGLGSALSGSWHRLSLLSNVLFTPGLVGKACILVLFDILIFGMLRTFEWKIPSKKSQGKGEQHASSWG